MLAAGVLLLQGCASYQFVSEKDPATGETNCRVSITSLREVDLGAISVNKDCGLSGSADALSSGNAMYMAIGEAVGRALIQQTTGGTVP